MNTSVITALRCALSILAITVSGFAQTQGETLYNGLTLPAGWLAPRAPTQEYRRPDYLVSPPAVIPIDLGRQLFVDDFLIEDTTLVRTPHRASMFAGNPILRPFQFPDLNPWAFPYSDGVWFDPADRLFKMWYMGGTGAQLSYAYSTDGKNWTRPVLPSAIPAGTNRVLDLGGGRDSNTIWMDLEDPDPSRKFKAFPYVAGSRVGIYFSPDGIIWTKQPQQIKTLNDRTTVFWNPFRKVWVNNIRGSASMPPIGWLPAQSVRARYYAESKDLRNWSPPEPYTTFWLAADQNDLPYLGPGGQPPQLYSMDAVAYESLMVGLFGFLHAGPEETPGYLPAPNLVELNIGFSRDGIQWDRPTRGVGATAFIPTSNSFGAWDGYNTQSVGGCFLVVGDELWFYFSGRSSQHYLPWQTTPSATGLARLRRDGFYSMDAAAQEGVLTTRQVRFSGNELFVNVDTPAGELRVEVLDSQNNVISPFTKANSVPVSVNKTLQKMSWSGASDLASIAGKPVKFRFHLTNGRLYSFWVTSHPDGASSGYVAAGGPGFAGPTDTVGNRNSGAATDVTAPEVAITFPVNNQKLTGTTAFTASASDDGSVAGVQFRVDGGDVGSEVTAAPYTIFFDPRSLKQGPHSLTAWARDGAGNAQLSATVIFQYTTLDTVPPAVSIASPSRDQAVTGTISLIAEASDSGGVAGVQFKVDGVNFGAELLKAPYALELNTMTLSSGPHSVNASARDASGNTQLSSSVPFVVAHNSVPPDHTPSTAAQSGRLAPAMGRVRDSVPALRIFGRLTPALSRTLEGQPVPGAIPPRRSQVQPGRFSHLYLPRE